jgi:TolA-binding protein
VEVKRLAIIAILAFAPGCFWVTTKHEGKKLRANVDDLDRRLVVKEASLETKISELEDVLAKATKLLQRNSADLGADVRALSEDNAKLNGLVAAARDLSKEVRTELGELRAQYDARFTDMETRLVALEQKAKAPPPKSAQEIFADGRRAMDSKSYKEARVQFATFKRKWPGHELADDAVYYWAEAHFKDKNFEKAIAVYQMVFDEYKSSQWADDAMFQAGQAAEKLKWCTDARVYYSAMQQKYPKSSLKKKAAARVKYLKKNAKKRKICQS